MATTNTCSRALLLLAALLVAGCAAQSEQQRQEDARQCRIRRFSASRPSKTYESDGGVTESWDQNEEQFQCAGVVAARSIIRPQGLAVPSYHNSPGLLYVLRGQGLHGVSYAGCPEPFHSGDDRSADRHQKVRRISKGDILAIAPGATSWCYNDGGDDLVTMLVFHVANPLNQLDQTLRSFPLAGGQSGQSKFSEKETARTYPSGGSIISGFETETIAEALNIPQDLARKLQRREGEYIVRVKKALRIALPEEEQEGREEETKYANSGIVEAFCSTRHRYNIDNPGEEDLSSRRAGRLNSVTSAKLSVLYLLGLSAEKGNLHPGAIFAPHWSINAHTVAYVTQGEGRVQIVDNQGNTVFNDNVRQGELIVVPQFFVSMMKAGNNGMQWISFKTDALPVRNLVAGQLSTVRELPLPVISSSFGVPLEQARQIKNNRKDDMILFPPSTAAKY